MAKQPPTTAETVGRNLEVQFSVSRIEQHSLARDIGVSSMTITRTLRHHKDTSTTTAKAMADALGIAPADLFDPDYPKLVEAIRKGVPHFRWEGHDGHVLFEEDLNDGYTANEPVFANIRKSFERRADWLRKQLDERIDCERAKIEGLLTDAVADPETYHRQDITDIGGEVLLCFQDVWDRSEHYPPELFQAVRETMAMLAAKKTTTKKTTTKKRSAKKRRKSKVARRKTKKTVAQDRR